MKMRLIKGLAVLFICLTAWLLFWSNKNRVRAVSPKSASIPQQSVPRRQSSMALGAGSQDSYLMALEQSGQMPEGDGKYDDWQLAQHTSWWGKPLDPKTFWKGRVLWNDAKVTSDAQRHGRLYPPMPYENTNLPPYANDEGIHGSYSPDGPNVLFASSSKEAVFWDIFDKTHPRPPDQIDHEQELRAHDFNRQDISYLIKQANEYNYPTEAFTTNALFWTYVQVKRAEYKRLLDSPAGAKEILFKRLMHNLLVDPKLITDPLTPEELQAANAWKVAYLQRLRQENADEQYVEGYMQAWNLSSNEVFGSGN